MIKIVLTWSKIMALIIFIGAVVLDFKNGGVSLTMFCIPFVVSLILGKQLIDKK